MQLNIEKLHRFRLLVVVSAPRGGRIACAGNGDGGVSLSLSAVYATSITAEAGLVSLLLASSTLIFN